jgi:serine/threonine protein kinase
MVETIPTIPGYELLGELGRGGMGIVYKAKDVRIDRLVAVKLILSGRGANLIDLARFRIEAEAVGSLEHPNIVQSHDIGVHLGYPFFVLEYAEGGSLAGRIRSQSISCDWTAQACLNLALAMQHAHERGIIHRDLKPSNVLLMSEDIPKITDFGLAKFRTPDGGQSVVQEFCTIHIPDKFGEPPPPETDLPKMVDANEAGMSFENYTIRTLWKQKLGTPAPEDEERLNGIGRFIQEALRQATLDLPKVAQVCDKLTQSGAIMGTPQYMAPEQAWGRIEEVGPAADIYSLGAVMYEMLTGRPPFSGDSYQVLMKKTSRPPISPRERRSSIEPGLEAICMKCLEMRIERRYESMGSLAEDLQRFLTGAEVGAVQETSLRDRQPGSVTEAQETQADSYRRSTTRRMVPTSTKTWWQFWK